MKTIFRNLSAVFRKGAYKYTMYINKIYIP